MSKEVKQGKSKKRKDSKEKYIKGNEIQLNLGRDGSPVARMVV